jgi:hypothetical protein
VKCDRRPTVAAASGESAVAHRQAIRRPEKAFDRCRYRPCVKYAPNSKQARFSAQWRWRHWLRKEKAPHRARPLIFGRPTNRSAGTNSEQMSQHGRRKCPNWGAGRRQFAANRGKRPTLTRRAKWVTGAHTATLTNAAQESATCRKASSSSARLALGLVASCRFQSEDTSPAALCNRNSTMDSAHVLCTTYCRFYSPRCTFARHLQSAH